MAIIELSIDDQTLARARQVAEARQTSIEAICTEVLELIGTDTEASPSTESSPTLSNGTTDVGDDQPIDERTLAYARRIAEVNRMSFEAALKHVLAQPRPPRPHAPGTVPHHPIIGLLADEPELADAIMESAYELRAQPWRLPPGE